MIGLAVAPRRRAGRDRLVARERDAEVDELLGAELEELDVDDDLGLGLVVHLDEPLGHGDLVGGVADDDRVELRDRRHPPQVEEAADHRRDVLHVAVREEERPDDLVFVLLAVLLRVLRDEDRLLVDHLVEVPRLPHRRLEGLLEGKVPKVDRELVVLQLRVEDDVDPGRGAEGLVDLLDRRVGRKRDVDRLVRRRVQHRRRRPAALRLRLGPLGRRAADSLQAARLDVLVDLLQLLQSDVVRRIERDALLQLHLREVELPRGAMEPPPAEVGMGGLNLRAEERRLVLLVRRVDGRRLLVGHDGHVPVLQPLVVLRLPERALGGAAGRAHGQGEDSGEKEGSGRSRSVNDHGSPFNGGRRAEGRGSAG